MDPMKHELRFDLSSTCIESMSMQTFRDQSLTEVSWWLLHSFKETWYPFFWYRKIHVTMKIRVKADQGYVDMLVARWRMRQYPRKGCRVHASPPLIHGRGFFYNLVRLLWPASFLYSPADGINWDHPVVVLVKGMR